MKHQTEKKMEHMEHEQASVCVSEHHGQCQTKHVVLSFNRCAWEGAPLALQMVARVHHDFADPAYMCA